MNTTIRYELEVFSNFGAWVALAGIKSSTINSRIKQLLKAGFDPNNIRVMKIIETREEVDHPLLNEANNKKGTVDPRTSSRRSENKKSSKKGIQS